MNDFTIPRDRGYLMKRVGDLSQIAGVKRYTLFEGRAAGVDAVDVETGAGLSFTVLPGRGMDIAWAKYKSVPFSYISKTGVVNASYYDPRGFNWLRSFFAGLLTTCGLSNAGNPSSDSHFLVGDIEHGLHGRISNTPAYGVAARNIWSGDDCAFEVSGTVRESSLHTENVTLQRTYISHLGAKSFAFTDIIANEGFVPHPLMLLYHINFGYPLIDEGSRICTASSQIKSAGLYSEERKDDLAKITAPITASCETQYFHTLKIDGEGFTKVAVINDKLQFAAWLKFNPSQLPCFTQWNQFSAAEYVLGLEPGTTIPLGLEEAKKTGLIEYLAPGQIKEVNIEIGIADGADEITAVEDEIRSMERSE